jgi:hypothetical protein
MACPLLDHTRSPWGVPSKKQSECLFGVIFPVSVLHEDGLKSIAICFGQTGGMHSSELMLSFGDSRRCSLVAVLPGTLQLRVPTVRFVEKYIEDENSSRYIISNGG